MSIGSRIREFRISLHLSQTEFGAKLGLIQQTIGKYESGIYEPNCETLNKIAGLGADLHYIITGKHYKAPIKLDHEAVLKQTLSGLKQQYDDLSRRLEAIEKNQPPARGKRGEQRHVLPEYADVTN